MVARSNAEGEFKSMAQSICELMWLRILLKELQVNVKEPYIVTIRLLPVLLIILYTMIGQKMCKLIGILSSRK